MAHAIVRENIAYGLQAASSFVDAHGVHHSGKVLRLWSEAELADIGVYPIVEVEIPDGYRSMDSKLQWDGQIVTRMHTLSEVPLSELKSQALSRLASIRFAHETGGITVENAPISTNRESQSLISGAYALAQKNPELTISFKTMSGFIGLDATSVISLATAVANHVQACFSREAELADRIEEAEDAQAIESIDLNIGWPAKNRPL